MLIGWGTAEMAGTKIIPLWVGARGVEFQWTNLQSALDANVSLVCLCVVGEMSSVSLLTASTSNLEGLHVHRHTKSLARETLLGLINTYWSIHIYIYLITLVPGIANQLWYNCASVVARD